MKNYSKHKKRSYENKTDKKPKTNLGKTLVRSSVRNVPRSVPDRIPNLGS